MGLFDSVYVQCPECGEDVEFQSKAGECSLASYTLDDVPDVVLHGVGDDCEICMKCGHVCRIHLPKHRPYVT